MDAPPGCGKRHAIGLVCGLRVVGVAVACTLQLERAGVAHVGVSQVPRAGELRCPVELGLAALPSDEVQPDLLRDGSGALVDSLAQILECQVLFQSDLDVHALLKREVLEIIHSQSSPLGQQETPSVYA